MIYLCRVGLHVTSTNHSLLVGNIYICCRRAGNPFNTTVIPSPPASPPSLSPFGAPPPQVVPGKQPNEPSTPSIAITSSRGQKFMTTKRLMWFSIAGLLILIALALALWLFLSKCCKRKPETNKIDKMQLGAFNTPKENPSHNESLVKPHNHLETGKLMLATLLQQYLLCFSYSFHTCVQFLERQL